MAGVADFAVVSNGPAVSLWIGSALKVGSAFLVTSQVTSIFPNHGCSVGVFFNAGLPDAADSAWQAHKNVLRI